MDSRIAYLNVRTILLDAELATSTVPPRNAVQRIPDCAEVHRPISTAIARNNLRNKAGSSNEISHITWEFQGVRASFLACATFDGTGDSGTTIARFAMPGHKLNRVQKALALLTFLQYSIENGAINADFDFMVHKISADFDGGVSDILSQFNSLTDESKALLQKIADAYRGEMSHAGSL